MAEMRPVRASPSLVSVIIPARNAAKTLSEQLASLANQSYRGKWEVIVADNGSTDATRSVAEKWSTSLPDLRVIDAGSVPGSSGARNAGAAAARGELLAFCDADDTVCAEWLASLVDAALENDIVTGTQDDAVLNKSFVRTWRSPRTPGLPRAGGFLPFAPSCNLAVWADVFRAVGGFDPAFPQAHDVEWSWRAQLAGFRLGFAPGALVHYRYRTRPGAILRQAYRTGFDAVRLQRRFAAAGLEPPPLSRLLRRWAWVVARTYLLASPRRRGLWLRRFGEASGHLIASVRLRTFCA